MGVVAKGMAVAYKQEKQQENRRKINAEEGILRTILECPATRSPHHLTLAVP